MSSHEHKGQDHLNRVDASPIPPFAQHFAPFVHANSGALIQLLVISLYTLPAGRLLVSAGEKNQMSSALPVLFASALCQCSARDSAETRIFCAHGTWAPFSALSKKARHP